MNTVKISDLHYGNLYLDEDGVILPIVGFKGTFVFHPEGVFSEINTLRHIQLTEQIIEKLGFEFCDYDPVEEGNEIEDSDVGHIYLIYKKNISRPDIDITLQLELNSNKSYSIILKYFNLQYCLGEINYVDELQNICRTFLGELDYERLL